jgi:hypothetical protein
MITWMRIIIFILTNAPGLYRAIRDLIDLFNGNNKQAAKMLAEMHAVVAKLENKDQEAKMIALSKIMEKYRRQIAAM